MNTAPQNRPAPQAQPPKKKHTGLIIFLVILVLLIIIIAVNGMKKSGTASADTTAGSVVAGSDTTEAAAAGAVGDYNVVIKNSKVYANTYTAGESDIVVTYTYTNNSDKAEEFDLAVTAKLFQNGIELSQILIPVGIDEANYSIDNMSKDVQPGYSLDVQVAYKLNDTTTDIDCEVAPLFGGDAIKYTIKLS